MFKNIFVIFLFLNYLNAASLKELLSNIEISNDNYQSQKALQEMSKKEYESSIRNHFPSFNLNGGYQNSYNVSALEPSNIAYGELNTSFVLYNGNKVLNNTLSKKNLNKSQDFKTKHLKQEIMLDVIKEYFSYQNTKYAIEATNYKINELNEQIKKSEILVSNELETKDRLQALIASQKESLYNIENLKIDLENSILKISLLTGIDILPNDTYEIIEPVFNNEERNDIQAQKLEAKSQELMVDTINYFPRITLNDSFKKQKFLNYNTSNNQSAYNLNDNKFTNQLTVQIEIPIFDFGKIYKDKEASKLQLLYLNKQISYKEKSIDIEKKLALKSLESAKIKLSSAILGLEATNTTYEYTKKRFDANLVSYTEYLSELTKKQDANYRVVVAKNDIELKKANLAFVLGIDLMEILKD